MAGIRFASALMLLALALLLPSSGRASQNCNRAPSSWGGSAAQEYKTWCEACGGKFSMNPNPSCAKGPNWGGGSSSGSGPSNSGSRDFYDYHADRQRREAEAQQLLQQQDAEEARKRQEEQQRKDNEFKRKQAEIFGSMKDISEKQLGTSAAGEDLKDALKDIDVSPPPKPAQKPAGPDCNVGGPVDSKIVDLRCLGLDPDQPIAVDPWVVKGKDRVFPAQIDPTTFLNFNYNKGFECLMKFDPVAAVRYFELAKQQRPRDPLVRNALLLAQDLVKAHEIKDREDKARAEYWRLHTFACLGKGEHGEALASITRAEGLDPKNERITSLAAVTQWIAKSTNPMDPAQKQKAYKLVGHALYEMSNQQWYESVGTLEAAQRLAPQDGDISAMLQIVRSYMADQRTTATDSSGAARKDILDKASKN